MHNQSNKDSRYNREVIERLNHIVPEIVDAFNPDEIIMYGSYARGDYSEDSDMDIIIVAEISMRFQDRSLRALEIISDDDSIPINPIVYTPSEFKDMLNKKESFLISALEESVLLWKKETDTNLESQLESHSIESEFKKYLPQIS